MGRCSWAAALIALLASLALAGAAAADGVTNAGDDLRTGWYPDEGALTPQLVSGGTFGQLWSAQVNGQVYAQPLLSPSGTLIVATENDKVYGLESGHGRTAMDERPRDTVESGGHRMRRHRALDRDDRDAGDRPVYQHRLPDP